MQYPRVILLFLGVISATHAQDLANRIYAGAFTGRFHCGGQWNDFTFRMSPGTSLLGVNDPDEPNTAVLNFVYRLSLTSISTAAYVLRGPYDPKTGHFRLEPLRWANSHPDNFEMVGIEGTFDAASRKMQARMLSEKCDAVEMAAPGQRLPPLPANVAPTGPTLPPGTSNRPEYKFSATTMNNFFDPNGSPPGLEYVLQSWYDLPGTHHQGSPIDESVSQFLEDKYACVGSSHVAWDASGTKGSANDAVSVREYYAIECLGDCKGVLYQPLAGATITYMGLSTPLPTVMIKAVNLGGRGFRWTFERKNNGQPPPDIYIHRWRPLTGAGPFDGTPEQMKRAQAAAPPCRAPTRGNR
jgi:hypothetical protein